MSDNGWGPPGEAPITGGPAGNTVDSFDMTAMMVSTTGAEDGHETATSGKDGHRTPTNAKDSHGAATDSKNGCGAATATSANNGLANGNKKDEAEKNGAEPEGWVEAQPYNYDAYSRDGPGDWEGNAQVYEYNGELGEVGPEHPELELMLFGKASERGSHGIDFAKIAEIEVSQEGPVRVDPVLTFETAGLHPVMARNVKLAGFQVPTPIQKYCIPAITAGYDVIAVAQTGSGKTAAYLIPIINKLMGKAKKLAAYRPNPAAPETAFHAPVRAEPLVVIVCPSRELAVQIFNEARKFCYRTMLRPCVVYGGGPVNDQAAQLAKGCDILVATPGRLIDFIERPRYLTLRRLMYMVIDEADEMLHPDWEQEFNKILSGGEQEEENVKYMLFSATFPKPTRDLARTHLAESHVRLHVGRAGSSHENIKQEVVYVQPPMKRQAVYDLLLSLEPCRVIIFVNNKITADELDDFLFHRHLPCTSMHSDRTQKEREASMRGFRSGQTPILIATGVSARGIDVRNVRHIINYDLPSMDHGGIEEYTHRIGRTGRIGHRGTATSFYCDKDEPMASVLTRTLLETKQEVPDFLQAYIPEGEARENLKFEADSDFDAGETAGDEGGWSDEGVSVWGGAGDDTGEDNSWGSSPESQPEDSGW